MPQHHLEDSKEILIDTIVSMFNANLRVNELAKLGQHKEALIYLNAEIITFKSQIEKAHHFRSQSKKIEQNGDKKGQLTKEAALNPDNVARIQKIDELCKIRDSIYNTILSTKKRLEEEPARQLALHKPPQVKQEMPVDESKTLVMEVAHKELEFENLIGKEAYEFYKTVRVLENYWSELNKPKASPELELADDSRTHLYQVGVELRKVIDELKYGAKDNEAIKIFSSVAKNTEALLTDRLSYQDYANLANTMQGKASPVLKILGGLMIALGCAVAMAGAPFIASALAVFASGAILSSATVGLGIGIAAISAVPGTILFSNNKVRNDGLCKHMHDLNMTKLNDSLRP